MSLLVETIKTKNGKLYNVSLHNDRMNRSLLEIFGKAGYYDLREMISIPPFAENGLYKCRVLYDDSSWSMEFVPYTIRKISSLKLVTDNNISYSHKYLERENINRLTRLRDNCDDILIIKNGMVTDSSYANVVFRDAQGRWVTPDTFLLPGIKRASLLKQGIITEERISFSDIKKYSEIKLINAMIDIEDTTGISVNNIF